MYEKCTSVVTYVQKCTPVVTDVHRFGICQKEAENINIGFVTRMLSNKPYVISKIAASLDGSVALSNGDSKWITNSECRRQVHITRACSDAIITTASTVIADNPDLTARDVDINFKHPIRVIIDKDLRLFNKKIGIGVDVDIRNLKIFKNQDISNTIVITSKLSNSDTDYKNSENINNINNSNIHESTYRINNHNINIYYIDLDKNNNINMLLVWELLAELGCNNIMIEAGGKFNGYLLKNNLANEWHQPLR